MPRNYPFTYVISSNQSTSNVEADHLCGRHLQLLVDSSLQVLVKQRLELLVLLVQKTSLFDQILTINQELIVFLERAIESLPD